LFWVWAAWEVLRPVTSRAEAKESSASNSIRLRTTKAHLTAHRVLSVKPITKTQPMCHCCNAPMNYGSSFSATHKLNS
jgi:hypothetical protein